MDCIIASMKEPRVVRAGPLLVALVAAASFAGALDNGIVWDDPVVLDEQLPRWSGGREALLAPADAPQATPHYYRPAVILSYQLDRAIAGRSEGRPSTDAALIRTMHATNVVLHAGATALVFALGRALLPVATVSPVVPFAAALLFAVHPIHVESVAWIAGRSDLLCTVFGLLAALAWLAARTRSQAVPAAGAAAAALASFLAKETGLSLVLLAPLLLLSPLPRDPRWRRPREAALPLLFLGGACLTYAALRASALPPGSDALGDRPGSAVAATLGALGWYAVKLVWPLPACALVGTPPGGPWVVAGLIVVLAAASFLGWSWSRRSVDAERIAFSLLVVTLLPALPVAARLVAKTSVAERYLYLPSAGFCLLVALLAARATHRSLATALVLVGAAAGAGATVLGTEVFADPFTFWERTARTCRGHGQPLLEYGILLGARGRTDEAIAAFEGALAEYGGEQPGTSWALNNLGNELRAAGRLPEAIERLRASVAGQPDYARARYNLALALLDAARDAPDPRPILEETRSQLEESVRLDPGHPGARLQYGLLLRRLGRHVEGDEQLREVLHLAPQSPFAERARDALRAPP